LIAVQTILCGKAAANIKALERLKRLIIKLHLTGLKADLNRLLSDWQCSAVSPKNRSDLLFIIFGNVEIFIFVLQFNNRTAIVCRAENHVSEPY